MKNNELSIYINQAIANIVSDVLRNTLSNPRETVFLLQYRKQIQISQQRRTDREKNGQHIPAFLISSITDSCNLVCKGCYSRNNGTCGGENEKAVLSADEWKSIFVQASGLGIGFHLLAGGEPLLRRDVVEQAASMRDTIFPIFTNGTLIDESYCVLFDTHRNLVPVLSIEGLQEATDSRRGDGVYEQLIEKMKMLKKHKVFFGVSVTVTKSNLKDVTDRDFIQQLHSMGCNVVFFIEYVPVDPSTEGLAFSDAERRELEKAQKVLRKDFPCTLFLSFPGDEIKMGGCLAAGRGFFHINPFGEAEACPFSPFSDRSLKTSTLLEVLQSPFFAKIQESNLAAGGHAGGCTLFEHEGLVKTILSEVKKGRS
jgi:MoaA/NifB/PqqE/SkfB family radical SAM enzyme